MISRQKQLQNILQQLEYTPLIQKQKNDFYQNVIKLRAQTSSSGFDYLGFNLLHWAVLCNQSTDEINRLITQEKVDINCGTDLVDSRHTCNITPLHFAVQTGNEALGQFLLNNGANQNIKRQFIWKVDHREHTGEVNESTPEFALHNANPAFKIFEKQFIDEYHEKRELDKRKYKSILPNSVASFFHYSKQDKFNAEQAYENLIKQENDNVNIVEDLKNLKKEHPAIDQGDLGEIYNASIKARM